MHDGIRTITDLAQLPLDAGDEAFLSALGGPTLVELPGADRTRRRVISTLLHGNEPSGIRALRAWLRSGAMPAVDTAFYIGSVAAALGPPLFGHRMLPGTRDANRCFLPPYEGPEGMLAADVLARLRALDPEVIVDIHNNTGHNPAYGVVTELGPVVLGVTRLFADRVMLSDLNMGTLVEAGSAFCPTVTIECGRAGDAIADAVALAGLERLLMAESTSEAPGAQPLEVLEHPLRVRVRPGVTVAFACDHRVDATLTLDEAIDRHNFASVPAGARLGWLAPDEPCPLEAIDASGHDRSQDLFEVADGELRLRQPTVPIMMTTDATIAVQDCLFYAMRRRG